MPDKPEYQQIPDVNESETSTTQRLLKKDTARSEAESATTAPLTGRLADLTQDTTEKKKSNTWLFVMIGAAVAVVVLVLGFMFFFTGESILSSGSTDISASGSDSINATIVEGQPVPDTRDTARNAPAPSERRRNSEPAETEPTPEPRQAESAPASQPEAPGVREARAQSSGSKPAETTKTADSRPEPPSEPPTANQETKPASSPPGSQADSSSATRSTKPAATAPASIQQGFDLKSQADKSAVKTGDLVPLTGDVIRPVLQKDVTPDKPAIATRLRRSGRVILRILIDESGNVIDAKVVNETPKNLGFGDAAMDAAMKRKYTPATKDNVRVKVWETLVFTFR
jgi:TonB family protein